MRKIGDKFLECNDRCRLVDYTGMVKNVLEDNYAAFMVIHGVLFIIPIIIKNFCQQHNLHNILRRYSTEF